MTKTMGSMFTAALLLAFTACSPEDRSGEQPFQPIVVNKACQVEADSCLLVGEVLKSPNSSLKGCGFRYGNYNTADTLRLEIKCEEAQMQFSAYTRRLEPGTYYAVAFAQNGMGKSFAPDSVYFTIEK